MNVINRINQLKDWKPHQINELYNDRKRTYEMSGED